MDTAGSFREILMLVVGQAFAAAGYALEERPVQWAGGSFRFHKPLAEGVTAVIEFQALMYQDTEWAAGNPSRFKVILSRRGGAAPVRRDLCALVVSDFGVPIVPSADHWWVFASLDALGKALAEAGYLVVGYGIPWLAGELLPPDVG